MEHALKELKTVLEGEVRTDAINKKIYSVDASIYEIEPLAIVIPKNQFDLINTVKIASKYGIPIIPRGAATGITGGCLGKGIVIDIAKNLNRLVEVNPSEHYIICEPGLVQNDLNDALKPYNLRLGPDTSTGDRATLGGMLANNAAGSRSLTFGRMIDHIIEVDVLLPNGELITFQPLTSEEWEQRADTSSTEGKIYRSIRHIREQYYDAIDQNFPKIPRRASGYPLDILLDTPTPNLAKFFAGSEGTLGIVTQMKINVTPILPKTSLCILHFNNMIEGMSAIEQILNYKPVSVEMLDNNIIEAARLSPSIQGKLGWLQGTPEAVFAVELTTGIESFASSMEKDNIGYAQVVIKDQDEQNHIWDVRKAGLGLLMSKRSYSRAIAFIEDVTVAPEKLAPFMTEFLSYLDKNGKSAGIYGHVGSGCMHIRPYMDLREPAELSLMKKIMHDVTAMLLKHNGLLSGEHGDGIVRSWLNKDLFGEKLVSAFEKLKGTFDPNNLMNPGKIVHPAPFLDNLRIPTQTTPKEIDTFLNFSKEGGLTLSADLCNGNALCRKKTGTMCPSFQATGNEYDSTRARAQVLRSIIHQRLPIKEWTGQGLKNVLDLCLSCKGCKNECPSQVDMAKMKSEFLHQYQKKHGATLRDNIVANISTINEWSAPFASIVNVLNKSTITKWFLDRLGIAKERDLPELAKERFTHWMKKQSLQEHKKEVILLADTFTEFNSPHVGQSAYKVLVQLGYKVTVPKYHCCGRPLITKGFLKEAKELAEVLIKSLVEAAKKGVPIIGLEPSCLITIIDDYQGLLGYDHEDLKLVREQCQTFDQFIAKDADNLPKSNEARAVLIHGHCHQKATTGIDELVHLIKTVTGSHAEVIDSGCCGMAGSFGYEKEHYEISQKIARLKLFPAIESLSEGGIVISNGFSCRHQISDGTGAIPLHIAEYLDRISDT